MTDYTSLQQSKAQCLAELREALPVYIGRLCRIDQRLVDYAHDLIRTDEDVHNLDELLCFRKFIRMLHTYEFDTELVREVLYDAEGEWEEQNGLLVHQHGGLKLDGIYGTDYYRLTTMQVYVLAWIFGFRHYVDTTSPVGSRQMMPSERAGEHGTILDNRRLTTKFVMMWPRKLAKTFISAFIQFEGLMRGERDYEGYIGTNNADQSKILFNAVLNMVEQLDGYQRYFKVTNSPQDRCIQWRRNTGRVGFIRALTAGGKTKDGLKASVNSFDEFGAAQRVQGKAADMEALINVLESSMGPRREPLSIHTSTAGLGIETPYEEMIGRMHDDLLTELAFPMTEPHPRETDWQGGIILRPDLWEMDNDDELRTERIIRKVNPNIGITVQPTFYAKEWADAVQQGDMKRKEVVTKLYNIFATDRALDWITPEEVRLLQIDRRIDDCTEEDGWRVYVGFDFSLGGDLNAASFLAVRNNDDGSVEFFADLEAYMSEEGMRDSTLGRLFERYADEGHLHIVPGKTLEPEVLLNRVVELYDNGISFYGFGYDPYRASTATQLIKQWLFAELGADNPKIANIVRPISQRAGNMNHLVEELDYMVKSTTPLIRFSQNPLWAFEFGNAVLVEDTMDNKRITKAKPQNKIDNILALCNALDCYDISEVSLYEE